MCFCCGLSASFLSGSALVRLVDASRTPLVLQAELPKATELYSGECAGIARLRNESSEAVIGWFEVAAIERNRLPVYGSGTVPSQVFPPKISGRTSPAREEGTAISVRRVVGLEPALQLATLGASTPPQSFQYLDWQGGRWAFPSSRLPQ